MTKITNRMKIICIFLGMIGKEDDNYLFPIVGTKQNVTRHSKTNFGI